jgi:hypothetical protein
MSKNPIPILERSISDLLKSGILPDMDMPALVTKKSEHPVYKKYSDLADKPIHNRLAERKYQVPSPTITRWVKRGLIRVLGKNKNRQMLNEQDIAYCADIYHQHDSPRGNWLFDESGLPYR